MKRLIVTVLLASMVAAGAHAQGKDQGKNKGFERLQAEKVAFITAELDLTPAEAQVFWPVYNEADRQMRESFEAGMKNFKALKEALEKNLPDEQVKPLLDAWLSSHGKNALAEHQADFVRVIGAAKTARLYVAEEEFRTRQLRRLSGMKPGPGQDRPGQDRQRPDRREQNRPESD